MFHVKSDKDKSDRAAAMRLVPVSRETEARLAIYADLLIRWQATVNLVAPSTLPVLWTRHIADSAQLLELAPQARTWVDLGSGSGCPGLIIAIQLAELSATLVHLVESDHRKSAFLRTAIRETGARAVVHTARIEDILPDLTPSVDVVCARALAPLPTLLDYSKNLLDKGAIGLFPKGRDIANELTQARASRKFTFELIASRTDPAARIVVVRAHAAGSDPPSSANSR